MADGKKTQPSKQNPLATSQTYKNNKLENTNPAETHKSSPEAPDSNSPQPRSSSDDIFKSRAISFLKNISTGSPLILARTGPAIEPLHLIPLETTHHLGIKRTQEEDIQIGKIQAWMTFGVLKKSYKHCLDSKFSFKPMINLNEFPGRLIPSPIKDKLNEEFSESHPQLDPKLTLSKLLNLREDLIEKVWKPVDFDPVTLAIGLTCFSRLLSNNLINKKNRKLYAAVCVLLAFKFVEETHMEDVKGKKEELLQRLYFMDKRDLLTVKMINEAEFCVYSYLGFSMHLELEEIQDELDYVLSRV